jgi:hypothetical protein
MSTCLPTFSISFSLDLPFPGYMNRNIYLSPYFPSPFFSGFTFPSLHGQKYLPASLLSLSLSLWIYIFHPAWTKISTCLPLPISLDLHFPSLHGQKYLPVSLSLSLWIYTFPAYMDRNIYLPPSSLSLSLWIYTFPAYMDRNTYLSPSPFHSGFTLSQPTWTEISTCLPLPFTLD